jgi:hypothetical protein
LTRNGTRQEKTNTLEALHKIKDTTDPRDLQTDASLCKEYNALLKRKREAQIQSVAMRLPEAARET